MDLSLYHNDELLRRRRNRVEDSPNDESFTVYFPFHSDTQTFTHTVLTGVLLQLFRINIPLLLGIIESERDFQIKYSTNI